ncbi:SUGP2 protein, partial [Copsychus sechellarum]|nr:SUGP2 protein [Copsychus sechellarum]
MASRRITRETFEAVVQDKVKRYRMERSDAAADSSMHRFKAQPRPLPRPRYAADGRFPHANSQHEEWSEDARDDYPMEEYPGETFPGPSYRASSPLLRKDNYFHGQFARPAPRQREFGRDYGRPAPQNREFGRGAVPNREYGQQNREYGQQNREYGQQNREYGQQNRDFGQQNRDFGRDRDYGQDYCWEGSGQHEPEFGSSDVLGDFRSPGLMEEEFGAVENQEYEEEEEEEEFGAPDAAFRLRRGGAVGRGRVLRGKRLTRGAVKPKGFKGDLKSPPKKWNVKKAQAGLEGEALEQPLDAAERPSGPRPLQQPPKLPPSHPLAAQRPVLRLPKLTHGFRNLSFDLVDKSDIFSTFGVEIIKWAGFHAVKNDAEFSRLFGALFELETETCAKMLASFKCSLRPEHRDYCFFTIKSLQHAALKTPKVDNEFLNMLLDKGAVKTKNCFFEIIKPFDKYIMRLQDRLLKGVTPLLMACNAYELSIKTSGLGSPREMASAFETTVSLCRKSLALLGQTFALASVFRQEKILEAVGLQEMAPAPTAFPNFDDSTLFGREYMEHLKAWLESSGFPLQMKRAEAQPAGLRGAAPGSAGSAGGAGGNSGVLLGVPGWGTPQRADRKVLDTIEQLVSSMVSGTLSAKDRNAQKNSPEYWWVFLADEESLEYKYFRLRLAEARRSSWGQGAAPGPGSLRALLCAARLKRRLLGGRRRAAIAPRAARARRGRRTSTAGQALLAAGTALKLQQKSSRTALPGPGVGGATALPGPGVDATSAPGGVTTALPGPGVDVTSAPGGVTSTPGNVTTALPGPGVDLTSAPGVDAKTMETAEKLARFVAQVGPEMEQFSIDNSADNPDLWFLQDQASPAFRFYRMKVSELCPPGALSPAARTPQLSDDDDSGSEPARAEEEEEDGDEDGDEDEDEEGGREEDALGRAAPEAGEGRGPGPTPATPAPSPAFPRKRVSSKSLRVGMIPASKRVCLIEEPKVHEPVRIAYDRPRGCPVTKKKKKGKELELPQKRLSPRNVGFQMLQRMGWQEGHGLGSRGRGIREPVHLGATSAGEGLGVAGQEEQEDAFDVFRQRMIQMYRQKRASK